MLGFKICDAAAAITIAGIERYTVSTKGSLLSVNSGSKTKLPLPSMLVVASSICTRAGRRLLRYEMKLGLKSLKSRCAAK